MLLFSKLNKLCFGYCDPENILLGNQNKWFPGWPNQYFWLTKTTRWEKLVLVQLEHATENATQRSYDREIFLLSRQFASWPRKRPRTPLHQRNMQLYYLCVPWNWNKLLASLELERKMCILERWQREMVCVIHELAYVSLKTATSVDDEPFNW